MASNFFEGMNNPFGDGEKMSSDKLAEAFVSMIMGALAQQPCNEVRKWIEEGLRLAFVSKITDMITRDIDDVIHEGPEKSREVVNRYTKEPMVSPEDIEKFVEIHMKNIDKLVLEGRDMSPEPSLSNPMGLPYNLNDVGAYMRVFARWLHDYIKAND